MKSIVVPIHSIQNRGDHIELFVVTYCLVRV